MNEREERVRRVVLAMAKMGLVIDILNAWSNRLTEKDFQQLKCAVEEPFLSSQIVNVCNVLVRVAAEFFPGTSLDTFNEWLRDTIHFFKDYREVLHPESPVDAIFAAFLMFGGYIPEDQILEAALIRGTQKFE